MDSEGWLPLQCERKAKAMACTFRDPICGRDVHEGIDDATALPSTERSLYIVRFSGAYFTFFPVLGLRRLAFLRIPSGFPSILVLRLGRDVGPVGMAFDSTSYDLPKSRYPSIHPRGCGEVRVPEVGPGMRPPGDSSSGSIHLCFRFRCGFLTTSSFSTYPAEHLGVGSSTILSLSKGGH